MLYVVRHGQTHMNKSGVIHGQKNIPLTSKGIEQALQVSAKLSDVKFQYCVCSPLQRAVQTATIIMKNHRQIEVNIDERLMERGKGVYEGAYVKKEIIRRLDSQKFGEIEDYSKFYQRVCSSIDEIIRAYPKENVLIVCHSGTIKAILKYAGIEVNEKIDNCECYQINQNEFKKENKMKKGFFPGSFDLLTIGHVLSFEECKKYCDYLIVGLQCCPTYMKPIQSIYERFMQLRSCKYVDEIIPYYDLNDCKGLLMSLDYDLYFLSNKYKNTDWENRELVESSGKEIIYLSKKYDYSSENLKKRVAEME